MQQKTWAERCSSEGLCAVQEMFAMMFTIFCTSMTGEKLQGGDCQLLVHRLLRAKTAPRYPSSFLTSYRMGISDLGHLTTPMSSKGTGKLIEHTE